jgi:hypothetical protein
MPVIAAYWFPWQLRLYHGVELLADALAYSAILVGLLASQDNTTLVKEHL